MTYQGSGKPLSQARARARGTRGALALPRIALLAALAAGSGAAWGAVGDLDATFGINANGRTLEAFSGVAPLAVAMTQQRDGKLIVTGRSIATNEMFVARFSTDGTPDLTFGADGHVLVPFASTSGAGFALLQDPNGKIVVAGQGQTSLGNYDFAVVRLNGDGSLDTTFGTNGIATFNGGGFDEAAAGLVRQSDGKLVVAGWSNASGNYNLFFVRFTTTGTLDTTFGSGGVRAVDFGGIDEAHSLTQQADGSLIAAGLTSSGTGAAANMAIVRVTANGALDTSFNGTGKQTVAFGALRSSVESVVVQADGKIVLAGSVQDNSVTTTTNGIVTSTTDGALARLNADGTLDKSFGTAGEVSITFGSRDFFSQVLVDPSGALVAVGQTQAASNPPTDGVLARFLANGTLDTSFGNGGKTILDCGDGVRASQCTGYAVALQSDGKYVTAGYDRSALRVALARYVGSGGYAGNVGLLTNAEVFADTAGTANVHVRRSGGQAGAVSVNYSAQDASAIAGRDYTLAPGTLSWADGDMSDKIIPVTVIPSNVAGFTGAFAILLAGATGGASLTTTQEAVTISNLNSAGAGNLGFLQPNVTVPDNAGSVTFTVSRTGSSTGAVTVSFATVDGTAVAGKDYTATSGTLSWADGDQTSKPFTVPVTVNATAAANKTFTVTLSPPTGGAVLSNGVLTVTIQNSQAAGTLNFVASTTTTVRPIGAVTLNVSRTLGSVGAITVNYSTADGTAVGGVDYTPTSGSLSWAAADVALKTLTVPILNPKTPTPAKTFTVTLSNPTSGALLGTLVVDTVTIGATVDGAIEFTQANFPVNAANDKSVTLTVSRIGSATGAATVDYNTAPATALAATDYTAISGTLSWADGDVTDRTITVALLNGPASAADKTFSVALFNPTGGAVTDDASKATITVLANTGTGTGTGSGGTTSSGKKGALDWLTLLIGTALLLLRAARRRTVPPGG